MKNHLIQKYEKENRWVNYEIVERKGKKTKMPYTISGKPASSTKESDWSTYRDARKASDRVGIVFTPKQDLLGIDIDHCLENGKIIHEFQEKIAEIILEANTYTEISPSGTGLHLFLEIDGTLPLTANRHGNFEAYTSGRYFTVTQKPYGEEREVRTVTPDEALEILKIIGYPWKKEEVVHTSTELSTLSSKKSEKEASASTGTLSDEQILDKMFNSKNGEKTKALYEGSLADHGNDASSADMAFLSHLAFWTRKDSQQMERMWLASPLGQREKTKTRLDYRSRSVNNAIKSCKNIYESPQQKMEAIAPDLDLLYVIGAKGNITYLQNVENMCRILRKHPNFANHFRYDAFKNIYEIKHTKDEKWRVIEDNDAVNIQTAISIHFTEWFGKVGKEMIYDAMIKVAKENTYDSAADFVRSLKWDGVARLDTWLTHTYGTPDDKYHVAVASNWVKGLVKRITEPGCKFDYVLVLEGEQGARKSTSLAILGGDWHVETTMSTDSKDFFMQFQGKAIIEFSEGETLSRTEVKRMKAIITMQTDKYRPPYERTSQDFPRRCVFAMTTNQTEYLKDETGNRRWLPVTVLLPQADTEWLTENRNQILAEAYHRVHDLKETVYEFPIEETLAQQQMRRISDPNEDKIMHWYMTEVSVQDKLAGITIDRVYKECLNGNFVSKSISKFEEMSIATVLKDHLKLTKKDSVRNGVRARRWFNETGLSMDLSEEESIQAFISKDF